MPYWLDRQIKRPREDRVLGGEGRIFEFLAFMQCMHGAPRKFWVFGFVGSQWLLDSSVH